MKSENITYFIVVTIVVSILIVALVLINVNGPVRKKKNTTTTSTTTTVTTNELADYSTEGREEKIIIEGMEETFVAKTYISRLGFRISYDVALFNPRVYGNNIVLLTYLNDENSYIKIEKLAESVYYQEYEKQTKENEIDGYKVEYNFYRGKNIYLKVTSSFPINSEYADLGVRMDYMIKSFL